MDWLCAPCKQERATRPRDAKLCVACSWREVREKSRTLLAALDAPLFDKYATRAHEPAAIPGAIDAELLMLGELARAVGEDPAVAVRYVASDGDRSDTRYRSEWNRLMSRFIGRLEATWASGA